MKIKLTQSNDVVQIEKSDGTIIDLASAGITPITYSDLKDLRDNEELVPGLFYRITDFVTTTSQLDTLSAGWQFDVIVRADDDHTLNEEASAAKHDGDTHFAHSNLEAWKLKYCLDNDTSRFTWANTQNGKGVIYYMKDEWNNECCYDFKNIMYKRWAVLDDYFGDPRYFGISGQSQVGCDTYTANTDDESDYNYFFTFSGFLDDSTDPWNGPEYVDASNTKCFTVTNVESMGYGNVSVPYNNSIKECFVHLILDDDETIYPVLTLPNITFQQFFLDEFSYCVHDNQISGNCRNLTCRSKSFHHNTFLSSNVHSCYFVGVNTSNNDFSNAEINNSFFIDTVINNIFTNCVFNKVTYAGHGLETFTERNNFLNAVFSRVCIFGTMTRNNFSNCIFSECNSYDNVNMINNDFTNATFDTCTFYHNRYEKNNFTSANMYDCELNVDMSECTFGIMKKIIFTDDPDNLDYERITGVRQVGSMWYEKKTILNLETGVNGGTFVLFKDDVESFDFVPIRNFKHA